MPPVNILLGITGGIAAYKTPELVRQLRKRGHAVRCVLTDNAGRLVARDALAAVSGAPVAMELWPDDGHMDHIDLARWAEVVLIAPATANVLAHLRLGLADDLLTTLALAFDPARPRLIAPAMNTVMWNQPAVQENLAVLVQRGWRTIGPVAGELACGEQGVGAMASPEVIADAI